MKGSINITLFIKILKYDILFVEIYVDNTLFGSTNSLLYEGFLRLMNKEFKMSMMGELSYLLEFSVK